MKARKIGRDTSERILQSACSVFAEKGFRDATVAEICLRAGANQAAVNYHFSDKRSLYFAVWKHSAAEEARLYPLDGGVAADAEAEDRLRGIIGSLVRRLGDQGALGYFQKIKVMEMAMPTGIIWEVVREYREPFRDHLRRVIREMLGPGFSAAEIDRCERGIVAQCMVVKEALRAPFCPEPPKPLSLREYELWTDHITRFSIAGIRSLRISRAIRRKPVKTRRS
jgi:AcrR family transcriptional regulator